MIVQLAKGVRLHTEELSRLKDQVAQAEELRDTLDRLEKLFLRMESWYNAFQIIRSRIPVTTGNHLLNTAWVIGHDLRAIQEAFVSGQMNHAVQLDRLLDSAHQLRAESQEAWHLAAQEQIAPFRDQATRAAYMPTMQHQLPQIHQLLQEADQIASRLPEHEPKAAQLFAILMKLNDLLGSQDVPLDIRIFLDRLRNGAATFADINPNVYAWLRAQGYSTNLRITFTD